MSRTRAAAIAAFAVLVVGIGVAVGSGSGLTRSVIYVTGTASAQVVWLAPAGGGRGYQTAGGWRSEHERFWREEVFPGWEGEVPVLDDSTPVVVEWFRLRERV